MIYLTIGFVYIVSVVLSYGASFENMQRKYPDIAENDYKKDKSWCILWSCLGPCSLIVAFFLTERFKYGFKFK